MTDHPEAEVRAVTGRPNDTPVRDPEPAPLGGNSTFAERARARKTGKPLAPTPAPEGGSTFAGRKAVKSESVEDKAVKPAAARKKG